MSGWLAGVGRNGSPRARAQVGVRLALVLVVMLTALLGSLGSAGAAGGNQGLQSGWAVDDGGNVAFEGSVYHTLGLMKSAGAGWVRINFRLGGCFPNWTSVGCNGKTALTTYDQVVDEARRLNLQVLGVLSNESWHGDQAQWTAGNAEHRLGNGDNTYLQAFASGAAVPLAKRFAGRVAAWEVWNEPNAWTSADGQGHYYGGTFMYPSNFAWLLRHVYEKSRQAKITGVQFISGGLFGHDIGGAAVVEVTAGGARRVVKHGDYTPRADAKADEPEVAVAVGESGAGYLRSTYQYGRSKAGWETLKKKYRSYPLDGIGQHLYIDQGGLTSAAKIKTYLDEVRAAYTTYEGSSTAKKTHLTEFGWTTANVSEAVQAANLQTAYNTLRATAYLGRGYWNAIQDVPAASLYYGLTYSSGGTVVNKPSFSAYQTAAAY